MQYDTAFQTTASDIRFGSGITSEVAMDLQDMGAGRALLIVDPALVDLPPVQNVVRSLETAGIDFEVFDGVVVEPTDRSFRSAAEAATDGQFDSFVAVGGGSTIDTAKVANLYSSHPADFFDYVNAPIGRGLAVPGPLKPLIAIPTTAGTGSEATGVAIFDHLDLRAKTGIAHRYLKPTLGIVDPDNSRTMPSAVAAAAGLDVLSSALESYTAMPFDQRPRPARPVERPAFQGSNPISDVWAIRALEIVDEYLIRTVRDPGDDEARSHMLLAAAITGSTNAGVHLPHGMSYPVAGMVREYRPPGYDIDHPLVPHGISVILNLPAVIRMTAGGDAQRHLRAAEALGADVSGALPEDAAEILHERVVFFMRALDMPNGLSSVGYTAEDIPALVEGTLPQHRVLDLAPIEAGGDVLTELFQGIADDLVMGLHAHTENSICRTSWISISSVLSRSHISEPIEANPHNPTTRNVQPKTMRGSAMISSLFQDGFKNIVIAGIILVLFSSCVPPDTDMSDQPVPPKGLSLEIDIGAELQEYLDNKIRKMNIPGVSLFVDIPGQKALSLSSGFSNIEQKTTLSPSDRFRIASITKTFTAAAILLLAENELLELGDPVEKWLPGAVPNSEEITIRQLLNHTSGISDYYQGEKGIKTQVAAGPQKIWFQSELIRVGVSMSPLFEPGEKWAYSNTGYIMLGLIIEKASGTSYRDFVHNRILDHLNLKDTFVPQNGTIPGNFSRGYVNTVEDEELKDVTNLHPSVIWSAGSMVSTTNDLARWTKAIYGGELLSDDSMRKMFSFVDIGHEDIKYGLGVYEYQEGIVGHDGDFMGYSSQIVYVIDSELTIGVLTNRLPPHATEIAIEVLQLLGKETS